MNASEHASAAELFLPLSSSHAATRPSPPTSSMKFACAADSAYTIDDLTQRDVPQLGLHASSFRDATFVAFSWPRTLMDGAAYRALVANCAAKLAGSSTFIEADSGKEDVLASGDLDDPSLSSHIERPCD